MLELTGNNLPLRQKELNKFVNEAISKKVNFDEIQSYEEHSDVDRLIKIDIASKYKNSEYIIETLKCGDSLYISRALKCEWLYSDDFSHIINPDYLHHNVFPSMSIKMKKKFLTTISCHVRNEDRMLNFYKYCKEIKLDDISYKFFMFTSEIHKLEYLKSGNSIGQLDVKNFFGNSFNLVETYLGQLRGMKLNTNDKIVEFSYLYSVSNEKYLNLLEEYSVQHNYNQRLGLRISKNIMTKHKERVLKNPILYINYLNMNMIAKYSTVEEAKQYIIALMPCQVSCFWSMNFYEANKILFNLIPHNEIYNFLRQIFLDKYGNEQFEMSKNFYDHEYYKLLTIEERELWALKHLEEKKELLGAGEDYLWYKFVNFDVAFKGIKKYIFKTVDKFKRGDIVNVLIYSVRNEQHLETLIKYYYERHVNEIENIKQNFIEKMTEQHNVFKFNDSCWNVFNKLLHSMNTFTAEYMDTYKACAIIYYITHAKEMPKNLKINEIHSYTLRQNFQPYFSHLTEEQIKVIYEYFIELFIEKIKEFDDKDHTDIENKDKICSIIDSIVEVLRHFKKTKHDCPDIVYKYVKMYWDMYADSEMFGEQNDAKPTEASLIRLLKQDKTQLLETLPGVINSFSSRWEFFRLNNLMKKLRIYFSNDITKNCVTIFESFLLKDFLSNERYVAFTAINGIFHVANDNYKVDFMTKYTPKDSKVAHDTIDQNILLIQEAICRFVYYSRPPIPLSHTLQFIKGDYLRFCLPMLNSMVANLPKTLSLQFIAALLDAPVSVQKHGLRLAFQCFNTEDLKQLIVNVWKKSKNVSLRKILYTSLIDYIRSVDEQLQQSFYEVLKFFTMNLNEDDDDDIFKRNRLPRSFKGDFLETVWNTVEKFPDQNSKNVERKILIINEMEENIDCMNKEFCRTQILDKLLNPSKFKENVEMPNRNDVKTRLTYHKWKLAIQYVNYFDNEKEMVRSMEFVSIITKGCIEMSEKYDARFTMYKFLVTFLEKVLKNACIFENKTPGALPILEHILTILDSMPMNAVYLLYWKYTSTIILIKALDSQIINPTTGEKDYERAKADEIATKFTNDLLLFMNCLKEKNLLFASLFNETAVIVNDVIDVFVGHIRSISNLASLIIQRLTETQAHETYLLAVMLFFEKFSTREYGSNIHLIYDNVFKFKDEEVITIMYHKLSSNVGNYF